MKKKYIISGMLGTLLLGFTTVFALNIVDPTMTNPIFKAVYIGGSSAGTTTCAGTTSPICLDSNGVYLNLSSVDNSNILKWNSIERKFSVGPLNGSDIPDNIITSTHIFDTAITNNKFDPSYTGFRIPTTGEMVVTTGNCGPGMASIGMTTGLMSCVNVSFLTGPSIPNCGTTGSAYTLILSGTQRVCKSNVVNVLGADGGDYRSGATTGDIRNRNINNVGVGLTNPTDKLTVQDSFSVNGGGGGSTPEMIYCHKTDTWVNKSSYIEANCAVCPSGYAYSTGNKLCEKTTVTINDRGFGSTVGFPDCGTANGKTYEKRQNVPINQLCANNGIPHINTGAANFSGEFKRFCSITDPNRVYQNSTYTGAYMEGEKCSLTLTKSLVDQRPYVDEYARCNSESEGKYRPTSSGSILSGVACYTGLPYGLVQHSGGAWTWACLGVDKDHSDFTCKSRDSTNDGNPLGLCNSTLEEHFLNFNAGGNGGYLTPSKYNELLNTTPQGYTGNFVNIINESFNNNLFHIWDGNDRTTEIPVGNYRDVYHQGLVNNFYVWSGNYYSGTKTITGITGAKLCNKGVASPVFASNHYGATKVPMNIWMCTDNGVSELCKQESHAQAFPSTPMCKSAKESFYNDGQRCISGDPYYTYTADGGIDGCRANYDNDYNYENDYFVQCDFNKLEYPVCASNGTNEHTGEVLSKTPNTNQGWGACGTDDGHTTCDYNLNLVLLEPGYWAGANPDNTSGWIYLTNTTLNSQTVDAYCKSATNKWYARRYYYDYPYQRDFEGGSCSISSGGDPEESCQDSYAACNGRTVPTRKIGTRYCVEENTTNYSSANPTVCSLSDPLVAGPCYQLGYSRGSTTLLVKDGLVAINSSDVDSSGTSLTCTNISCRTNSDCGANTCNGYIPATGTTQPEGIFYEGNDIRVTHGTTTYIIADRNLGATVAGTGSASYGYYFQWGNNYGFPNIGTVSPYSTTQVNAGSYGASTYSSSTFIGGSLSNGDWSSIKNDNLRGDTTNTNIARKGPCGSGYHVPSYLEWEGLKTTLETIGAAGGTNFMNNLKLPMAGSRYYDGASAIYDQDSLGVYWSSTPADNADIYSYILDFGPDENSVVANDQEDRAYAHSVRCFKDPSDATPSSCNGYLPARTNPEGTCVGTFTTTGLTRQINDTEYYQSIESQTDEGTRIEVNSNNGFPSMPNTAPTSLGQIANETNVCREGNLYEARIVNTLIGPISGCGGVRREAVANGSNINECNTITSQSACTPSGCTWDTNITNIPEELGTCSSTIISSDTAVLLVNGTGGVRATTMVNYSDARIKTNIQKINNALEDITRLNGYQFTWIDSGKPDFGVLAQEVEKVFATMVSEDANGIKAVNYTELLAPIIEAIHEINTRVDELTREAQEQALRIDTLEK